MDFAKNLLSKLGWQDGEGLGREKQGIKQAIKANLKFDQAGLGADAASEFNNHWWERAFNDAAKNVDVLKEDNGNISLDLKDKQNSVEISTKSYSVKKLSESGSSVYSNHFLAADAAASNTFAVTKYQVLTDDELFKACGGRTAHKGARHGLKLSGKISRLEQQEAELLAKMLARKNEANKINSTEEPSKKVKKSNKESCSKKEVQIQSAECLQNDDLDVNVNLKRKKRKRKDMSPSNEEQINEKLVPEKTKKKKKVEDTLEKEELSKEEAIKQTGETFSAKIKKKKKKEFVETLEQEAQIPEDTSPAKTKKRKKEFVDTLEQEAQISEDTLPAKTKKKKRKNEIIETMEQSQIAEDVLPLKIKKKKKKTVDTMEVPTTTIKSKKSKSNKN